MYTCDLILKSDNSGKLTNNFAPLNTWHFNRTILMFIKLMFSDTDECTDGTHNCDVNADCTNHVGNFTCSCKSGFTGSGTIGNCTGKGIIHLFLSDRITITI